jgi:haloalkane dehalogenase
MPVDQTMNTVIDWRSEYAGSSRDVVIDGWRFHYREAGCGPPVLFVHGNPTWSFFWRDYLRELSTTHRTIAVDHIGCGHSDKPRCYDYRLSRHVANLGQFIDRLDLRDITLVGHDWGGAIGLGAVIEREDRVSRLVFFNTGLFPPPFFPLRIRVCRTPWMGTMAVRGFNLFARAARSMAAANPAKLSPEFKAGIIAPYDSWANRIAIDRFVRDIPTGRESPTWKLLEQIETSSRRFHNHPVCLIWGMRDWCFRPECLERIIALFPHAEVHRIGNAGHWVVEEAKDQTIPIMRKFLNVDVRRMMAAEA